MGTLSAMKSITLVGHSGCKLEVAELQGSLVVIKTSKDVAYNSRLAAQHEKQKAFKQDAFRVPAVLDSRHENGLFTFSMEYVHGFTLAEHLKKADASSIQSIADKFLSLIPKKHAYDYGAKKVFDNKLTELEPKIDLRSNATVGKAFRKLQEYEWEYSIFSDCHGDLSLENIIWKDGDLYLIDFLDSFYDSWMIDFAKLLLDIECLWSYRHESTVDENLKTRLSILKDILLGELLSLEDGKRIVHTMYHMALINLLRMLPYTKEERTLKQLHTGVARIHYLLDLTSGK